jgi:hypothetical protein
MRRQRTRALGEGASDAALTVGTEYPDETTSERVMLKIAPDLARVH